MTSTARWQVNRRTVHRAAERLDSFKSGSQTQIVLKRPSRPEAEMLRCMLDATGLEWVEHENSNGENVYEYVEDLADENQDVRDYMEAH